METDSSSSGRGRGRGRGRGGGGTALLPSGLWDSLHRDDDKDEGKNSSIPLPITLDQTIHDDDDNDKEKYDDNSDNDNNNNDQGGKHSTTDEKPAWAKDTDWNCEKCSNLNWSWRDFCNKCTNPKPKELREKLKKKDERRDGLGGGFNEKQDRAMNVLSVEVDDEGFDDFGRRVKKVNVDKSAKEAAALQRLNQSYGFLLTGQLPPDIKINKNNNNKDNDKVKDDGGSRRQRSRSRDRNDRRRDNRRSRSPDRNSRRRSRSRDRRRSRSRDRNDRRR